MSYLKKVCVLKQLDSSFSLPNKSLGGIVRLEQESGVTTLFCSIIDLSLFPHGEFYLFILDGKKEIFSIPLGKRPTSFSRAIDFDLDLKLGFAAGLCFIASDLPTLAAFGLTDGFNLTAKEFRKAVAERCLSIRKSKPQKDVFQNNVVKSDELQNNAFQNDKTVSSAFEYNDEAVATENYYELDDSIKEKLSIFEDLENERIRAENGKSTCRSKEEKDQSKNNCNRSKNEADDGYGKKYSVGSDFIGQAAVGSFDKTVGSPNQAAKPTERAETPLNETTFSGSACSDAAFTDAAETDTFSADEKSTMPFDEDNPYFFYAGKELDNLFDKFPEDFSLKTVLPASRWVRINYSADKYYVVGVVFSLEGDTSCKKPLYICYGVPEKYSATPPQALKDYCSFVPISLFDLHGEGFWMMFQDAVSGDCVKMSNKK